MSYAELAKQSDRLFRRITNHSSSKPLSVKADRHMLQLDQLDQPLWPAGPDQTWPAITKGQALAYYALVAPALLPQLKDRPLILHRFPQGLASQSHVQRHPDHPLPDYITTVDMYSDLASRNMDYILCQDTASLLWLVNWHALEIYPWYSRITAADTKLPTIFINSSGTLEMSVANYPDFLVFDLDSIKPLNQPPALTTSPLSPEQVAAQLDQNFVDQFNRNKEAALFVHQHLAKQGLTAFVKTSGKNGLHIVVPIHRRYPYDQVRQVARTIGQQLVDTYPQLFSMGWQLDQHTRVSIDFHQNARNKAFSAPYGLRATPTATISLPLTWKELEHLTHPAYITINQFLNPNPTSSIGQLSAIATPQHNPWHDILDHAQELPL